MRTIYKYTIDPDTKVQTFVMPGCAKVLTVQMQGAAVCLWAQVNTDHAAEDRRFAVYGTGHSLPNDDGNTSLNYIGTFQPNEGGSPLVFHLFEIVG
jgi:hypothetical protein